MSSPTFSTLRQTLRKIRRRHSRLYLLKYLSLAIIAAAALVLAMTGVEAWLDPGRDGSIGLFAATVFGVVVILGLLGRALYLKRADDRNLAQYVETRIPDLEQRLLTSLEFTDDELIHGRRGVSNQFIQQLWLDAQEHVQQQERHVETAIPAKQSWLTFAGAAAVVAAIALLFTVSETLLTAGSKLAWPFAIYEPEPEVVAPPAPVEITIEPGNLELQRGSSVTIIAQVNNAIPANVTLRVQDDNVNWRDYTMSRDGSGSDSATYSYYIPMLDEDTTYYVTFTEADEHNSPQYQIDLFDLPQVEQIDVAFDFPEYTGYEDNEEEDSGDMVVPEGTEVGLTVTFNKPIAEATLVFQPSYNEEGEEVIVYEDIPLGLDGNLGTVSFHGDGRRCVSSCGTGF